MLKREVERLVTAETAWHRAKERLLSRIAILNCDPKLIIETEQATVSYLEMFHMEPKSAVNG